jgi:hypothetical protein
VAALGQGSAFDAHLRWVADRDLAQAGGGRVLIGAVGRGSAGDHQRAVAVDEKLRVRAVHRVVGVGKVECADDDRALPGHVDRVKPAAGDRVYDVALRLDDVGLVDARLLHVGRARRGTAGTLVGGGNIRHRAGAVSAGIELGRHGQVLEDAAAERRGVAAVVMAEPVTGRERLQRPALAAGGSLAAIRPVDRRGSVRGDQRERDDRNRERKTADPLPYHPCHSPTLRGRTGSVTPHRK